MGGTVKRVVIVGDWDADGVVSAAQLYYSQEKLGRFPYNGRARVVLRPAGPRSILERLGEEYCGDYLLILDIPYTDMVDKALEAMYRACRPRIYYFDHHSSTIEAAASIEDRYEALMFVGRSPTSIIVGNTLARVGVKLTPRLRQFMLAVSILEGWRGADAKSVPQGIVSMAASISKSLNHFKDEELWIRYVKWLSNPLPFETESLPGLSDDIVSAGMEISQRADEEVRLAATDLAMTARQVGYLSLVDARGKWNKRGASALASAIHKMMRSPVALLVERDDGALILIIRSSRGEAERIMEALFSQGLLEDVGGHGNISIGRLRGDVTMEALEEALRRASIETARGAR